MQPVMVNTSGYPTRRLTSPSPEIVALLDATLGKVPVECWKPHTGLSPAERFVARFADGSSVFVKAAVDDATEAELRLEHAVISGSSGDFLPQPLAWVEAGRRPLLLLEDLSDAHWPADHWPVDWKPGQFDVLFETIERVALTAPPACVPRADVAFVPQWPIVARDADRFLALGVCSDAWFRAALDGLIDAEAAVPLGGDSLVHADVRSDNVCFVGTRMTLVDWGAARRGHRHHDLATALTTLPLEGGPEPFDVFPSGGSWAAYHAGLAARRACLPSCGLPGTDIAPEWFRKVIERLVVICLAWAARSLDLPRWDGPHWNDIR